MGKIEAQLILCMWIFSGPSTICWKHDPFLVESPYIFWPHWGQEGRGTHLPLGRRTGWGREERDWRVKTVKVLVTQCPTLCDPMEGSPPSSSVRGILQPRTLEWVAFPFSRGSSQRRGWTQVSHIAGRFFLSHHGSPRILEWVAWPFSRGFPQPRDWTQVSLIAGRFFTAWATRQDWRLVMW